VQEVSSSTGEAGTGWVSFVSCSASEGSQG
jgi:hypothetical protein